MTDREFEAQVRNTLGDVRAKLDGLDAILEARREQGDSETERQPGGCAKFLGMTILAALLYIAWVATC